MVICLKQTVAGQSFFISWR